MDNETKKPKEEEDALTHGVPFGVSCHIDDLCEVTVRPKTANGGRVLPCRRYD